MKLLLLVLLVISLIHADAQDQILDDSIKFLNLRKEFDKYEAQHGHYIITPNVRMHYLTWGTPSGIPLVWAHGTYSNAYELFEFADSLIKQGYFLIGIDYYGHGFTKIPEKEVSIYHVADDIRFLLDELKISKAVIGGWSRGGSIATAFYDAYPDRVLGIILEDGGSVAWAVNNHRKPIEQYTNEITNAFSEEQVFLNQSSDTEMEACRKWIGNSFYEKKEVFKAIASIGRNNEGKYVPNLGVRDFIGENSPDELLTFYYKPFASTKLFAASTILLYPLIVYRNLDVPLLILDPVSDDDQFKFEDENRKLQMAHPMMISHKIYTNTSHALKFDRPGDFLDDLNSFKYRINGIKRKNR